MLNYDKFYKTHGIRYIRDLLTPIVWSSEVISYPKQTALIWYNPTTTTNCPSKDYGYFNNLNKPYVLTIPTYTNFAHLGNPTYRKVNIINSVRDCKKKSNKYKFVKDHTKKLSVTNNSELLFNLGAINSSYRYISHPLTTYYVWWNTLKTAVDIASIKNTGIDRHKYIIMHLPYNIPSKELIAKSMSDVTRTTLDTFTDYTYFNILELFRFVSKEHKDRSILATLPETDFKYIDLILTINNKTVFLNLELLASITDAYEVTSKLKKYSSVTIIKLLIVFFNRIIEAAPQFATSAVIDTANAIDLEKLDISLDNIPTKEKDNKVDINVIVDDVSTDELTDSSDDDVIKDIESSLDIIDTEDKIEDVTALSIEDINHTEELKDNTKLIEATDALYSNKVITKTTKDNLTKVLVNQSKLKSPYNDGKTLGDMLTYTKEEIILSSKNTKLNDSPSVIDKTMNQDTLTTANNTYRDKTYRKDILSTIYAIQKSGAVITEHEVTIKNTALGGEENHKISVQSLDGNKSSFNLIIPVLNEDNTITMSGNNYIMRKQRADIPIKKISNTIVSINSYYGKLFVSKATYKKDDLGFWFYKQLLKQYDVDKQLKDIAALPVVQPEASVPSHYGMLSRYIKSFSYKGMVFSFDYSGRKHLIKDIDLSKTEKTSVLVGNKGTTPILMGNDNIITLGKDKLGTIFDILGIDIDKGPVEYINVKIYKEQIPLAVILSYYIGLHHLLKILKVKYTTIPSNKRVTLLPTEYKIKFQDVTYIITKDYGRVDLVLGGFKSVDKYIKNISSSTLMSKSTFPALFTAMNLPILYVNEIKLMENMYIDPITKQVLELFKLPTKFVGVLIKTSEILVDDNYKHPNSIEGSIIKGYERISGMMYLELVKALRLNINKSHFGKSKIEISPYAVKNKINEDSTTVLVDDINPIATMKQYDDVTYLGSHGRKEETMSVGTRVMHSSEIGIISEATKDNGAVGISAYMTAAPKLNTTRGTVGKIESKDGWSTRLTTSAMLAPFGTKEDPKRLNFASIQNAHIIPIANMRAPYIRTGYESVLGVRAGNNFVISAIDDGVVTSVSNKNVTVTYKTEGKKVYALKEWTTKEESFTTYTHKLVANVKKGDKFSKDDTLCYDKLFFEPDVFNPKQVIYRSGTSTLVALMEAPETYEDSVAISAKMSSKLETIVTKVKSVVVNNTDAILKPLSVGDEVTPGSALFSIADETLAAVSDLDDKALEILKGLKMLTPKSSYKGTITKIKIFYNCELSTMSPSLRKLTKISDESLVSDTGNTGEVNSSYSIQGNPLQPDSVEIKYYIDIHEGMSTGDKAILSNQLKCTVGEVFKSPVIAEDGSEIEAIFSTRSIEARITNGPGLIGTTSKLLEVVAKKAADLYFK